MNSHCSLQIQLFIGIQEIERALDDYTVAPRGTWVLSWPGQAVLCVSSTYGTTFIHEAFAKGGDALKKYLELNNSQIYDIVELVRGKLSKQNRTTLGNLALIYN